MEAKKIKKQLDKLWSETVRARDGRCVICGRTEFLNAHHIFGRTASATRWDIENGITLCSKHHTFDNTISPHTTRGSRNWWRFIEMYLGKEKRDEFEKKASKTKRWKRSELQDVKKELKKIKKEYENK